MSLKGIIYKFIMNTIGKNSEGITIAKTYGLNSAEMMEYVYLRVPSPNGKGLFGTWADSIFLDFPTWKSLRERKKNIQNILYNILKGRLEREPEKEIKILDLASGYSQYIFHVLDKLEDKAAKIYVEMRDKNLSCEKNISKYNKREYNVKFVKADITKEEDYDFSNKFDIILLTGFFDSIGMSDTNIIEHTIKLVDKIMREDALFIFSYQASHVNADLVNELFTDTNGIPLSMGERSKVDIKYFLESANFTNIGHVADKEGCYPIVVSVKKDSNVDFIKRVLDNKNEKVI